MDDFLEKLLYKTDIVDLISKDVKLSQKGNTFWGLCPFHHEKTPSFAVDRDKQLFHCFGCKQSGNAITYVAKTSNVSNFEAVKILAERAGLEMPKHGYSGLDNKKRARYLALMLDLARHYRENLYSPVGKPMLDYILSRNFTPEIIRKFGLGASVDFSDAISFLRGKGYTDEEMKITGVAAVGKDGRLYDVFNRRLIVPIINHLGEVVAFGGRSLEKKPEIAKYRNSTQTPIFDKSDILYGANTLKKRKMTAPIEYLIITEGYMDVIALHQAGFDTAVASMGTALTERQARRIKNYAQKVYVSYDGDTAGQMATLRGMDILKNAGLTVKVVSLPDGLDPDDIIKQRGAEGYRELLDAAKPLTAFKLENLAKKYDVNDPDSRAKMAVEGAKIIKNLPTIVEQEQYLPLLSSLTGFTVDVLRSQADLSEEEEALPPPPPRIGVVKSNAALDYILLTRLRFPENCDYSIDLSDCMPDEFSKKIYDYTQENRSPITASLVFEVVEGDARLNALFDYEPMPGDGENKYKECALDVKISALSAKKDGLMEEFKNTSDVTLLKKVDAIGKEIEKLTRQRKSIW